MKMLGRIPLLEKVKQEFSWRLTRASAHAGWSADTVHLLASDDEKHSLTVLLPSSDGEDDNELLEGTAGSLTLDCQVAVRPPPSDSPPGGGDQEEKGSAEAATCSLNVEEFECGVTSGNGDMEKQEWSFTLYDFDGRGKVTKEDLATLMKSLYEVVGSSLKLQGQQRGNTNKSFKLRLTMAPESSAGSVCDLETPSSSCADQPQGSHNSGAAGGSRGEGSGGLSVLSRRKKRQQSDETNLQRKRSSPPVGGSLPSQPPDTGTGSSPSPQGAASAQQAPSSRSTRSRGDRRAKEPSSRSSTRPHSSRQSHTRGSQEMAPAGGSGGGGGPSDTDVYHYQTSNTAAAAAAAHLLARPFPTGGLLTTAAPEHSPSERYRHVIRNAAAVDYPLRPFETAALTGPGGPAGAPTSVTGPPSPRHAKRHHRRNRDLAMQHVAEWLQREPLQVWTSGRECPAGAEDGPSPDEIPPRVVIHEHRHVHEHHHHYYYHHYHDA